MSHLLMLGTRKGLFLCRKLNSEWTIWRTAFLGSQVPVVMFDDRDQTLYAGLHLGHFGPKLHRSNDFGATWQEIAAPAFPPKGENDPTIRCPMRGVEIPWNVELLWSMAAGGVDEPGVLWMGTIPGGLFRSTNRGETWELNRELWDQPDRAKWMGGGYDYPGIHSICVDPRDSKRIVLGISCGGTWQTRDGGSTWANCSHGMRADYVPPEMAGNIDSQDPHFLVQCVGSPDNFWIQHHNGIFRSTNDCESWTEIVCSDPSSFGFAVAVHPQNPEIAWFAPAQKDEVRIPVGGKFVTTRTNDGGKTFDVLEKGLPTGPAYDLIYRHGLDISADGELLAMGSTTGSAWASENSGENWKMVGQHFPPIFTVRVARDN